MDHTYPNAEKGLILRGIVSERVRKYIGEEKNEVVTYLISDGRGCFFLDEYRPAEYFNIGDEIEAPVVCRPYIRKNGKAGAAFTIRRNSRITLAGEGF